MRSLPRSGIEWESAKGELRRRLGERRWRELIKAQGRSGLSVEAFCAQEGVSPSSFYAWRRRFQASSLKNKPGSKARGTGGSNRTSQDHRQDHAKSRSRGAGRFVRVEAANPLVDRVEVVWPRGVVIRVPVSCLEQVVGLVDRDGAC